MKDPTAGWRAEHENFSRLLDLFEREIARIHAEERPDYELMLDVLTYLRHFPEHQHHPREDVAFARLIGHDPSVSPLVNRFLQEHRVISEAGRRLHELLEGILGDGMIERVRLEAECATFLVYYRHHIAGEDTLVIPLAGKTLTGDDWKAVGEAISHAPDPLFGAQVEQRYRELRRRIEAEAQV